MKKSDQEKNNTNALGPSFADAVVDYLFLLERKYPQSSVLKMVGDRYKLSSIERSVLYRGIASGDEALKRYQKLTEPQFLRDNELHIDGYNQLITIGSYLNGNLVFVSNDSILRDASEIHGKVFRTLLFDKAILLLFAWLDIIRPGSVYFYFDEPVSHSGDLCLKINQVLTHYHFQGLAITCKSPDYHLKMMDTGYIATSDSGIIDRCKVNVIDIARHVLSFHYKKEFLDMRSLVCSLAL